MADGRRCWVMLVARQASRHLSQVSLLITSRLDLTGLCRFNVGLDVVEGRMRTRY